jgi:hypothetical protein
MVAMARVRLSEQQWSAIAEASGLPKRARKRIEHLLANYQALQQASATRSRAAQTRKELLHIAELAEKLITAVMSVNADAIAALIPPTSRLAADADDWAAVVSTASSDLSKIDHAPLIKLLDRRTPTTRDSLKLLDERVLTVGQLRHWFENAARSLPAETRGAHKAAENHQWLVGQLDAILAQFTGRQGRHISRTYKNDLQRYVELCFRVADPKLRSGSINNAIKDYVALNPRLSIAVPELRKKGALNSGAGLS